jgi:uncharacterized protein YcfL
MEIVMKKLFILLIPLFIFISCANDNDEPEAPAWTVVTNGVEHSCGIKLKTNELLVWFMQLSKR